MPSVTEIKLNKVRPLFPARFAPMILANRFPLNAVIIHVSLARIEREKVHVIYCTTVTDGIKINEQYKSIGIGPLYQQTEFEAI